VKIVNGKQNLVKRALLATSGAAVLLLCCAIVLTIWIQIRRPDPSRVMFYKFYLDMFKTVIGGFLVAMLGVLIPAVVAESKYNFERLKASRVAYSRVKTGIDYLKLRLAAMDFKEAGAHLQAVHLQKHQADLYDELQLWLTRRFGPEMTMDDWDDMTYRKLLRARLLLQEKEAQWNNMHPADRVKALEVILNDN
jgi:hypothetical protein